MAGTKKTLPTPGCLTQIEEWTLLPEHVEVKSAFIHITPIHNNSYLMHLTGVGLEPYSLRVIAIFLIGHNEVHAESYLK